ncbi:MAG: hypothetical protein RIS64_4493 [Bacteroidota bacterium]|jgi:uncharacterized protein (DUF58 family)
MDSSELLKKVRKIEIKTKGLSANVFAGEYHSAFKGRGMSFSEVRAYQYGDDVRNIDWNVTARSQTPFIKVFEEERELTVMLLIDMSRSAFFGTRTQFKSDMITELCAVLAFSAINNNDKVGVIFFSDMIEKFIPPQKGRTHILRIIRELLSFEPKGTGTDLAKGLQYLNNVIKKRSTCFLLSDFMARGYEDALRISSKRHDIIGIHVFDPAEAVLPPVGLMRAIDAETGRRLWIDTDDPKTQRKFAEWYQENLKYFKTTFAQTGADTMSLRTDKPYLDELLRFFKQRR